MSKNHRRTLHIVLGVVLILAAALYVALVRVPERPRIVWVQALPGAGDRTTYAAVARAAPGGRVVLGHRLSFTLAPDEREDVVFLTEEPPALSALLALLVRTPTIHAYHRAGPPRASGGDTWLPFEAREPRRR